MLVKRYMKKMKSILKNFNRKKKIGLKLAFANFIYDVNGALFKCVKIQNKAFDIKTKEINKYIENYCTDVLNNSTWLEPVTLNSNEDLQVWTFWFQKIESAPDIVKACLEQMKRVVKNKNYKLHILTMENIKEYIDIPNYIEKKVYDGEMGLALFSDFVRISLLEKYGGLWVDSTCYIIDIPNQVKQYAFFSCKSDKNTYHLISHEQWANYCLGTNQKHSKLYQFLKNILVCYWKKENIDVDYLLTDYLIRFAYDNLDEVRIDIDELPCNNPRRGVLIGMLNKPFDIMFWKKITTETWLFKLTYKHETKHHTETGEDTFYHKIITGNL